MYPGLFFIYPQVSGKRKMQAVGDLLIFANQLGMYAYEPGFKYPARHIIPEHSTLN